MFGKKELISVTLSLFVFIGLITIMIISTTHVGFSVCNYANTKAEKIFVNDSNSVTRNNYELCVNLTFQTGMDSKFRYGTICDSSDNKLNYYLPEGLSTDSTNAYICWKESQITAGQNDIVYYEYANTSATDKPSSQFSVFAKYDDFNDTSLNTTTFSALGTCSNRTEFNSILRQVGTAGQNCWINSSLTGENTSILVKANISANDVYVMFAGANVGLPLMSINRNSNALPSGFVWRNWNASQSDINADNSCLNNYCWYEISRDGTGTGKIMARINFGTYVNNTGQYSYNYNLYPSLLVAQATGKLDIDTFLQKSFFYPEPNITRVETITIASDSTTLSSPTNGSTFALSVINYTFIANSTTQSTFTCWLNQSGTITSLGTITNATLTTTGQITLPGRYSSNIICATGTSNSTSTTATFDNYKFYSNQTSVSPNITFETQPFNASTIIQTWGGLQECVVAYYDYNGTNYSATIEEVTPLTTSNNAFKANVQVETPLVETNNSQISNKWYYYLRETGIPSGCGSIDYFNTTAPANQTVYWHTWVSSIPVRTASKPIPSFASAVVGENMTISPILSTVWAGNSNRTVNITFNGTSYTTSYNSSSVTIPTNVTNEYFLKYLTLGNISGENQTLQHTATAIVSFNGTTYYRTSGIFNLTAYQFLIGTCSGLTATPVFNISIYDENSEAPTISTVEMNSTFWFDSMTKGYNNTFTGANNYSICFYPNFTTAQANITLFYYNTTAYAPRYYFIKNMSIPSISSNLPLYLLESGLAYNVSVSVKDISGTSEAGLIVAFLRWKVGQNKFITVSQIETSGLEYDKIPLLINDVYYRVIVYKDGKVVLTREPWYGSTSITLSYNLNEIGNYWNYTGRIGGSCSVYSSGENRTISCVVTDVSGLSTNSYFEVLQGNEFGFPNTTVYSTSGNAPGIEYLYTIENITDKVFYYTLRADVSGDSKVLLTNGYVDGRSNLQVSNFAGIVGTILIVGLLLGIGLWSPSASMLLAGLGLLLSKWLGLFPIPTVYLTVLLIGLGLLAWKVRA